MESIQSMKKLNAHFLMKNKSSRKQDSNRVADAGGRMPLKNGKIPVLLSDRGSVSSFIQENFDTIVFDCDGVLYRGSHLIPNMTETLTSLISSDKHVMFLTNNAGLSRLQLQQKLQRLFGQNCPISEEQIISSSYACANYMKEKEIQASQQHKWNNNSKQNINVYVVGTAGLCQELRNFGFNVLTYSDGDKYNMNRDELEEYNFFDFPPIDFVVCGLDTNFNYRKLCIVTNILDQQKDAEFLATNMDSFDLVGDSPAKKLPGNGSIVKAIEVSSQRKANNIGKPSAFLANFILKKHGNIRNPLRTLMVGDRLDTDIAFAKMGGMSSALVLTGVTTVDKIIEIDVEESMREPMPDIIFPHAGLMA
jgi:4-nitrophenyl phosphatase